MTYKIMKILWDLKAYGIYTNLDLPTNLGATGISDIS